MKYLVLVSHGGLAAGYFGPDGNPFTLDKLFQNPDAAKEIFINEISSQLTFRQADEAVQTEILNSVDRKSVV